MTLCSLHTARMLPAASAAFRVPMIWSSEKRARFISERRSGKEVMIVPEWMRVPAHQEPAALTWSPEPERRGLWEGLCACELILLPLTSSTDEFTPKHRGVWWGDIYPLQQA